MLTFLPLPRIAELIEEHDRDRSKRVAQHALAFEFVALIHGTSEANAVSWQHRQLFRPRSSTAEPTPVPQMHGGIPGHPQSPFKDYANPQSSNVYAPSTTFANMPSIQMTLPASLVYNHSFSKVLAHAGMVSSKSEGGRLLSQGGAYVGCRPSGIDTRSGPVMDGLTFVPIKNWFPEETEKYVIDGILLLRMGKWKFKAIHVVSDEEFDKLAGQLDGWEEIDKHRHSSERGDERREAKKGKISGHKAAEKKA